MFSSGLLIDSFDKLQSFKDKTIIVWAEQGLGDCIQFSRYLSILLDYGIVFDFYCHSSLIPLSQLVYVHFLIYRLILQS